jgi:hypothetical protein
MVHRDSMAILLLVRALKLETAAEGRSLWKRISACARWAFLSSTLRSGGAADIHAVPAVHR